MKLLNWRNKYKTWKGIKLKETLMLKKTKIKGCKFWRPFQSLKWRNLENKRARKGKKLFYLVNLWTSFALIGCGSCISSWIKSYNHSRQHAHLGLDLCLSFLLGCYFSSGNQVKTPRMRSVTWFRPRMGPTCNARGLSGHTPRTGVLTGIPLLFLNSDHKLICSTLYVPRTSRIE